jgi:endonuclease YncB( thermonuclease family)
VNVNARMVEEGHAWAYRQYLRADTRFLCELENDARVRRRGLWATDAWIYPPEWRKAKRTKAEAFGDYRLETSRACLAAAH